MRFKIYRNNKVIAKARFLTQARVIKKRFEKQFPVAKIEIKNY